MKMRTNIRATDAERVAKLDAATQASASTPSERERGEQYLAHLNANFYAWLNCVPTPRYGTVEKV
jgi:hypothetical protein